MKIRDSIAAILAAALLTVGATAANAGNLSVTANASAGKAAQITVYKSPTCGCCEGWIDHLRDEGFDVAARDRENMQPIKQSAGVPANLQSCHTALVDGYVIEGHVPAADIKRLLTERPEVAGLTAPGMPMKSPGMQSPGLPPKGYDVLSFDKHGKTVVFTRY